MTEADVPGNGGRGRATVDVEESQRGARRDPPRIGPVAVADGEQMAVRAEHGARLRTVEARPQDRAGAATGRGEEHDGAVGPRRGDQAVRPHRGRLDVGDREPTEPAARSARPTRRGGHR